MIQPAFRVCEVVTHARFLDQLRRRRSRELGVKVFEGQRRLSLLGFRMGGKAGYGLRRMMVSADGRRKHKLRVGEWKNIKTDRIILVPGPKKEVECVRRIFSMTVHDKKTPRQIANELNRKGIKFVSGRRWNFQSVYHILRNPEYAGYSTWGRTTQRLHTAIARLPRSQWIMKRGSFVPVVDEGIFQRAQEVILKRKNYPRKSDKQLLDKLKRVLIREGRLTERIIGHSRGVFHERTYGKRFGSLLVWDSQDTELIRHTPDNHISERDSVGQRLHCGVSGLFSVPETFTLRFRRPPMSANDRCFRI